MPAAARARTLALAAALAVSLVAGACGSDDDEEAAEDAAGGETVTLTVKDFAFSPTPLEVAKGTKVTLKNEDSAPHTATADDEKAFDAHADAGGSAEFTVSGGGEITYHCEIHDYMKGVIQVTG